MSSRNLEHLLEGAHCSDGTTLHYKTIIKPEQVGDKYKSYAGFCLVEDLGCPYASKIDSQYLCNNRFIPYEKESKEYNSNSKKRRK